MRLMSTAEPMTDVKENPEDNTFSLSSPRRQGAGMVNMDKAYHTSVYLEGMDVKGANGIGKSKVVLKNSDKIRNGEISISFIGHNESNVNKSYTVKLTVMRPAVASTTDIVTKDYNDRGEVSEIQNFPGYTYWEVEGIASFAKNVQKVSEGNFEYRDVFEATKDIEYFATEQDLIDNNPTVIAKGKYYNAGNSEVADWKPLPTNDYQSTLDKVIDVVTLDTVTIKPGDNKYTLNSYTLDDQVKAEIKKYYQYGCYIEGYVEFESLNNDEIDLSMPFMGYYNNYANAPVYEPFNFEKKDDTVYPSDLANDLAKRLLGKDKVDMSSMMLAGYVEPGKELSTDSVLYNNDNFKNFTGFYELGKDASTGEYFSNPSRNLYLGGERATNTLIIQQFILRSVKDNSFTITNTKTNKVVYKSALKDMVYGDYWDTYPLYKSHVNDSFLGAGIVCARALAVVPLYDTQTGEAFASGDYTLKFEYNLASGSSTSKSYALHIDNTAPKVEKIEITNDSVRVIVNEDYLSGAVIGKYTKEATKLSSGKYVVSFPREELEQHLEENFNVTSGSGRLYIGLTDQSRNKMGALVRFNHFVVENTEGNVKTETDTVSYQLIQHPDLGLTNDFEYSGNQLIVTKYDAKGNKYLPVQIDGIVSLVSGKYRVIKTTTTTEVEETIEYEVEEVIVEEVEVEVPVTKTITVNACGGNIETTSIVLAVISGLAIVLVIVGTRKRKHEGGNF